MPAWRLNGVAVQAEKFDVAAQDSLTAAEFVGHVGLLNDGPKELGKDKGLPKVSMVHMLPPFADNRHLWEVHVVGTASLTPGEVLQINALCQARDLEYKARKVRGEEQYVIRPHVKLPDADHPYYRYSCAGFVIEAYGWAGIDLVVTSDQDLPKVPLAALKKAYPRYAETLDDPVERTKYGLEELEPEEADGWPVVLAGYVMNALRPGAEDIRRAPYKPSAGDEFFPSRRAEMAKEQV
jgi:hypothetical protein